MNGMTQVTPVFLRLRRLGSTTHQMSEGEEQLRWQLVTRRELKVRGMNEGRKERKKSEKRQVEKQ